MRPGMSNFSKNMVSGAARAEAALLVIDAEEGVRENSRRHGYMLAMLGIRQIAVLVNNSDLVGWSEDVYENIKKEYGEFLAEINITPSAFYTGFGSARATILQGIRKTCPGIRA